MRTEGYYELAARLNLLNTSRTAEHGIVDISVSGKSTDHPSRISKDTIGNYTPEKIDQLQKENEKAASLDIKSLMTLSSDEIKELTINNFNAVLSIVLQQARDAASTGRVGSINLARMIEDLAKRLGKGIVLENKWFREHDSKKLPYTKVARLEEEFYKFCEQFLNKLKNIPKGEEEKSEWAKKTSAWVEYRINLTDHFMTDSCGKVAAIMAAFVCILVNHPLPVFSDKDEYLLHAPRRPRDINIQDENEDKQYKKWEEYYVAKFVNKRQLINIKLDASSEEKKEYYRINALDNLILSKTSKTGAPSTTGYEGKEKQIKKRAPIEVKSLVIANFSSLIDYFSQIKGDVVDKNYLRDLIKRIAFQLNENNLNVRPQDNISTFFRDEDGSYFYARHTELPKKFDLFIDEILPRINNYGEYDFLETIALIHYRIFLHYFFFKDGNHRIALALVTYVCMRFDLKLPQFSASDKKERHYIKETVTTDNIDEDPQFILWFSFYRSLFPNNTFTRIGEDDTFEDGWDVTTERMLDRNFTIYETGLRSFEEIEEMKNATNYEAKDLIVFNPKRMLLHELIVYIKTQLKIDYELFTRDSSIIIDGFFKDKYILEEISLLSKEFEDKRNNFTNYISYIVEDYFHMVNVDEDLQKRIQKFNDCIKQRIKEGKCNIRLSESKQLMKKLIVDDLLRDFFKAKIRTIVKNYFQNEEQKNKFEALVLKENYKRVAWAIVGGPAAGKGGLKRGVYRQVRVADGCCVVNPDDYKLLLETDAVKSDNHRYASLVHEESSYVTDEILRRLKEMVEADNAPNILLDIVTSSAKKMAIAGHGGATVYLNIASCPVEGTMGAVNRAFKRAQDQSTNNPDRNRYVPTQAILKGHKEESRLLPGTIKKFKVNLRLFDTSGDKKQPPKLVTAIDTHNKQLKVYEPRCFYQFIKKAVLNEKATFEEGVYPDDMTGESVAELFMNYLKSGIELSFLYGREVVHPKVMKLMKKKERLKKHIENNVDNAHYKEKLEKVKQKIIQLKKESTFAIFSLTRGIICNDFEALCNIFSDEADARKATQEFLLYFICRPILKDLDKIQNFPFYLYDADGYCILKKDEETKFQIQFDQQSLEKTCPLISLRVKSPAIISI